MSANTDVAANTAHRNTAAIHEKPKVDGVEILELDTPNLESVGAGVFRVSPSVLQNPFLFGTLRLKDNGDGKVYLSTDGGTTWFYLLDQNTPEVMYTFTYDTDENGIVDKAEELFNGTDAITIADVQQLQSDVSTLLSDVSALQSALSALDARVTALEGV